MRAPIGLKIRNYRKSLGLSQSGLARTIGISPSYLNLIEGNKRDVGGVLLQKIAASLSIELEELTGESEQRLIQELEEAFTDPVFDATHFSNADAVALVAQFPGVANALTRLFRAYGDVNALLEAQSNRLRSDPLFSALLHQILSHITALRSSAEILEDEGDLSEAENQRFLSSINREARAMSDVGQTLIQHFDQTADHRRSISPARELDDLIFNERNHFPALEDAAAQLRQGFDGGRGFGEAALAEVLDARFNVQVERGRSPDANESGFPGQSYFDANRRVMWFQGSTTAATRQFQLAQLLAELAAPDVINAQINDPRLTSPAARRLAHRAMSAYLAGALVFPYAAFLEDAENHAYDIDFLSQTYTASFEQVAHRLVTLRREGEEGIPFGFLRSDPAGRLTKQFPLPGLLLPNSGHACPLWAIYAAFRSPGQAVRQVVQFADGSRYLFVAKTVSKRLATFKDQPFHSSVMLACDILYADRTIYGQGLDLDDPTADVPVGPACRLCVRRACAYRQEEALSPGAEGTTMRSSLVPQRFELGESN
ncbi:helix-turn-helix domain-containing protein [Mariluticola halotolerans]|uniref:helix-turn-helix domain-containing protein n=1 Tax=Mariluticola halotolerans TaxID=2909283 RepID=UPI0026E3FCF8|nr:XRE family transcriptional regulator [Mariluticola halotolerans]UJQ95563.1 short-chain fatty acyl-CoA regulator family protein [Mariluticola halotolerans]